MDRRNYLAVATSRFRISITARAVPTFSPANIDDLWSGRDPLPPYVLPGKCKQKRRTPIRIAAFKPLSDKLLFETRRLCLSNVAGSLLLGLTGGRLIKNRGW